MKKAVCLLFMAILILLLSACGAENPQEMILRELNIEVLSTEITGYDTHSGNGDGISYFELHCADDTVLKQIKADPAWQSFPLDATVTTLIYGIEDGSISIGPFLADNAGRALIPPVANGYYLLLDRQSGSYHYTEDMVQRASFNFSLGVYDIDNNILYYCRLDT